jgi:hypothetical protein
VAAIDDNLPAPAARARRSLTVRAREVFLDSLRAGWSVTHAADHAGFGRERFYEMRRADSVFEEQWDAAVETGTDRLEDEARRRAVEGWLEDTTGGDGELIRRVQRYSPQLLIGLLKARRPSWRENAGAQTSPVTIQLVSLREIARERREGRESDGVIEIEIPAADIRELEPGGGS